MLSFPAAIKVYLCTVPCDMRRSFDGLSMMAEQVIGCNPYAGHLRVFSNRRTDRVKILYWDRDGWAIWYKRWEAGTFQFPFAETRRKEIAAWELAVLLEGIDLSKGRRRVEKAPQEGRRRELPENILGEGCMFLLTTSDSSCMTQGMNLTEIERRIEALRERLTHLGPMHPGSLSEQYNVCGKAGCRCKDPKHPQKHGPYYQLSFTWRGKSTTRFVRPEHLTEVRQKVANYQRFRELVNAWVDLEVARERAERAREKQAREH
jgi:transposase